LLSRRLLPISASFCRTRSFLSFRPHTAARCRSTQNCGAGQCANAARGKAGSAGLPRAGALHFTIAKILCKASVHVQARSRTRQPAAHVHGTWRTRRSRALSTLGISRNRVHILHTRIIFIHALYTHCTCACVPRLSSFSFSFTATPSQHRHLSHAARVCIQSACVVSARCSSLDHGECIFSHVCIDRRTENEREGRDRWIVTCRSDVYTHPRRVLAHLNFLFFSSSRSSSSALSYVTSPVYNANVCVCSGEIYISDNG